MIEIKDVSFTYESGESENSLRNINLKIKDGETVLLCGESGCGKTTLTRLINGLIPHYYNGQLTGQIYLDGKGLSAISDCSHGWLCISKPENTVLQCRYDKRDCVWMRKYGVAGAGNAGKA